MRTQVKGLPPIDARCAAHPLRMSKALNHVQWPTLVSEESRAMTMGTVVKTSRVSDMIDFR